MFPAVYFSFAAVNKITCLYDCFKSLTNSVYNCFKPTIHKYFIQKTTI